MGSILFMDNGLREKKKLVIILSLFILLFLIGMAIFVYKVLDGKTTQKWEKDYSNATKLAEKENLPLFIAVVNNPCSEKNPECPSPKAREDLHGFVLVEVLPGSKTYLELGYDDRFSRELESLPKFFLLNADGEIRDLKSSFPDEELIERWKRIR